MRLTGEMRPLRVFDNFLPDAEAYRAEAAARDDFRSFDFPEVGVTFHGIAAPTPLNVIAKLQRMFPTLTATLSFFRRSPQGQVEPHFIHTDADMGDYTALLYLNLAPPMRDGTSFWRYLPTGAIGSAAPHERSAEGMTADPALWKRWNHVKARFNRLVLFPATHFHSRALFDNWSAEGEDRLTQVVFWKGAP
jgi:hypothetical protein